MALMSSGDARCFGRVEPHLGLHAPAESAKIGDALFKAMSDKPLAAQKLDGFYGHHAVRPTTVGHDVALPWQLGETRPQLGDWNRDRAWNVTCAVLFDWTHIQNRDFSTPHAAKQLIPSDSLQRSTLLEVGAGHLLNFSQSRLCQLTQQHEEATDLLIGQPVLDIEALLLGFHKSRRPQDLEMLRGISHR